MKKVTFTRNNEKCFKNAKIQTINLHTIAVLLLFFCHNISEFLTDVRVPSLKMYPRKPILQVINNSKS